jgi:hypothetical protein
MLNRMTLMLVVIVGLYFIWHKEIHNTIHCASVHEYNNQHNLLWREH